MNRRHELPKLWLIQFPLALALVLTVWAVILVGVAVVVVQGIRLCHWLSSLL